MIKKEEKKIKKVTPKRQALTGFEAKRTNRKTFSQSEVLKRKERRQNIEEAAFASLEEIYLKYSTSYHGLEEDQVFENADEFGKNRVVKGKKKSIFKRFADAYLNMFSVILIVLVLVSTVTDIIIPKIKGTFENINYITISIILILVIVSGTIRFIQEIRSDSSAAKLLKMITTTTCIERLHEGKEELPLSEVVVGDIVHLSNGDMIPADIRIIECKDFFVNESSLTGESDHVEKLSGKTTKYSESVSDYRNIAFMGTTVISGSARGVVIAVGEDTQFGAIAKTLNVKSEATSFEKGVNSVSKILIRFMVFMIPLVFIINGLTKKDWLQALLFAISIAVGLTPEMLPMIVTASLAKGAINMSKKKTIIKNLNSIQNFGAMDVLCTDKTGTLTQNKVVLEYALNVDGVEDARVLRHAYLNSYFQTGFKNLMDIAIIKRREKMESTNEKLADLSEEYTKVDEIPFDFERKRLSVVVVDKKGKSQMVTKGALEEMLSISKYVEIGGEVQELTDEIKKRVYEITDGLNNDGMRVIAVSQKTNPAPVGQFGVKDEVEMVLIGFLAFLDPPKATTEQAIAALHKYGVTVKVLTGDNEKVTATVCEKVGMASTEFILGPQVEEMEDDELAEAVEKYNIFAKLTPEQKARIVKALKENGHTVGFLGDGINDAPALKVADVGISVDDAVDIAKETADIILLEKDLMVLEKGIIEGRKTYGNMIKYIKMTASSNFGNMFSVLIASALIPFLPMKSLYLILLNLIYDMSCTAIPWDHVDEAFLKVPRKWKADNISKFMIWFGPTSSIFDWITYGVMFGIICPMMAGGKWGSPGVDRELFIAAFQTGWFIQSMWSQTFVIHMLRTDKVSFFQSNASLQVYGTTLLGIAILTILPWTSFGSSIGLAVLQWPFFVYLIISTIAYMLLTTVVKKLYIRKYGEVL